VGRTAMYGNDVWFTRLGRKRHRMTAEGGSLQLGRHTKLRRASLHSLHGFDYAPTGQVVMTLLRPKGVSPCARKIHSCSLLSL